MLVSEFIFWRSRTRFWAVVCLRLPNPAACYDVGSLADSGPFSWRSRTLAKLFWSWESILVIFFLSSCCLLFPMIVFSRFSLAELNFIPCLEKKGCESASLQLIRSRGLPHISFSRISLSSCDIESVSRIWACSIRYSIKLLISAVAEDRLLWVWLKNGFIPVASS